MANDGSASKSVRRKHRILYEESQRRLSELELRLNSLRQIQPKQKKKPRPQTEIGRFMFIFYFILIDPIFINKALDKFSILFSFLMK